MQYWIRDAAQSDAPAVAEIYRPVVESTTISFEETAPGADEIARRIGETTRTHPWLVAESGEGVLGYAYGSRHRERWAYRYSVDVSVYVGQTARRGGIGAALYEALFARLRDLGFHRAFAGIALPNEASIALHRRCGFEPVGIYKEVGRKFDRWLDVAWWQKPL